MALPLLRIDIKFEHDVVLARQRARQTAQLLGFDAQDQARIGTAVSELARNVFQYAGSGKVELLIEPQGEPGFHIRISDAGKGIDDVERILAGDYVSKTGMGLGIIGARRLMDGFDITSTPGKGTTILIVKHFLSKMPPWTERRIADVAQALASHNTQDPFAEIQQSRRGGALRRAGRARRLPQTRIGAENAIPI
jgi:anti-sigma regulatory factor (Ser/Thr protein kinase)